MVDPFGLPLVLQLRFLEERLVVFLLLLRKSVAYYLFIASLIGVLITMSHAIGIANSVVNFSTPDFTMMIVMPVVMAVFLVWYSRFLFNKHLIN